MKTEKTAPSASLRSLCDSLVVHLSTPQEPHSPRLASDAVFSVFRSHERGFTLIETLVAIALLTTAIVAPIALTVQSLQSAYYARDQITAFYLAQEAIEALRSVRDGQILQITQTGSGASSINIFGPIPLSDVPFRIDAGQTDSTKAITNCSNDNLPGGVCEPLLTNGTLYGYQGGMTPTNFTRTVKAHFIGNGQDEIRVTVTVTWQTGSYQIRTFSISANMYRWVQDGSGATI